MFTDYVRDFLYTTDFLLDIKIADSDTKLNVKSESDSDFEPQTNSGISSQQLVLANTSTENLEHNVPLITEVYTITQMEDNDDPSALPSVQQIKRIPAVMKFLKQKSLKSRERSKIGKAIIACILNRNPTRRLTTEDFLQLSQSIVDIFPFEVMETYYLPFHKRRLPRGRLYYAYIKQKTILSAAGIIPRHLNSNPEINGESVQQHNNSSQLIIDLKSEPCDYSNLDSNCESIKRSNSPQLINDLKTEPCDDYSNPETNCKSIKRSNSPQLINDLKLEPCDDLEFEICSQSSSLSCIDNAEASNLSQNHCVSNTETLSSLPSVERIKQFPEIVQLLNSKTLQKEDRMKVAKTIIEYILNPQPNRKLSKDDFSQLAQSIVDIFPMEVKESYFIRYSKGKLFDAYYNNRVKLCEAGILKKRHCDTSYKNEEPKNNSDGEHDEETYFTSEPMTDPSALPSVRQIRRIREMKPFLKHKSLTSKERSKIATAIIAYILKRNPKRRLSKEDYLHLSQSIVKIFPFEKRETYYIPYHQGHNQKGKLYNAYLHNKQKIKLGATRIKYKCSNSNNESNSTHSIDDLESEPCESNYESIQQHSYSPQLSVLKSAPCDELKFETCTQSSSLSCMNNADASNDNVYDESIIRNNETITPHELEVLAAMDSDWNLIKDLWRKSYSHRRKEILNDEINTQDYINRYNIPKLNENLYDLLQIDFHILYSSTKNISVWKRYYPKVLKFSKFQHTKDFNVRNIFAYINKTNDEDSQLALSLMLIPHMLPKSRITKFESQESFISYKKSQKVYDRTENPAKRLKTETQLKIYFIGADAGHGISAAYLDLFGNRLKFENPLKAVEACFYCYTAMNIKYPQACHQTWLFLQKLIYEINTPHDIEIPAVNTLIDNLRREN
ncbi:uncharacterized protein isoform X2 [Musca autumnalis]